MSEQETSTVEPTFQLRWMKRIVRPTADKEKLMTFLQQEWKVIVYDRDGVGTVVRTEWRDVPTVMEE